MLSPLSEAVFYFHGFLIDLIYVAIIAVVLWLVVEFVLRRPDLARKVAAIAVVIGLLIALVDNLS